MGGGDSEGEAQEKSCSALRHVRAAQHNGEKRETGACGAAGADGAGREGKALTKLQRGAAFQTRLTREAWPCYPSSRPAALQLRSEWGGEGDRGDCCSHGERWPSPLALTGGCFPLGLVGGMGKKCPNSVLASPGKERGQVCFSVRKE